MRVLKGSVQVEPKIACNLCFMAHQVVEKALRAGMLHLLGLNASGVQHPELLSHHAYAIRSERHTTDTVRLCSIASSLEKHYEGSRRPSALNPTAAPVDVYTIVEAEECAEKAETALQIIRRLIEDVRTMEPPCQ